MADEQSMSKRERQKARRQERLEAERAAAKSQRAKKSVATFAVVAVVVGLLGAWGFSAYSDWQERRDAIELARASYEELGCTEIEEQPIGSSDHLGGNELAANPPETLYPDRPTTSGRHLPSVAQSGFYDKVVDERLLVHNLEHGYVNMFFDESVQGDELAEIQDFVEEQLGGTGEKIVASRWKADLPGDGRVAFAAWGARQVCEQWDRGIALGFLQEWHYLEGNAPERTVQPHRGGTSGGADPNETEGDLLFPPLGDDPVGGDVMEEPEGNVEEGEDGPRDDAGTDEPTEDSTE